MRRKWKLWVAIIALICIIGSCGDLAEKAETNSGVETVENESYYNKEETHSKTEDKVVENAPGNDVSGDASETEKNESLAEIKEEQSAEKEQSSIEEILDKMEVHFFKP